MQDSKQKISRDLVIKKVV